MFRWNRPRVYLQLEPDNILVKDVVSGQFVSEEPVAAIDSRRRDTIVAIGVAAHAHALTVGISLVNPFKHPRTLVANPTLAEAVLRSVLNKLYAQRFFMPAPKILMHPLQVPAGGFAPIELQALREIALNAGACSASLWTGRKLTDDEIRKYGFAGTNASRT